MERDEKYPTFVNHVFKTDEFSFKNAHYHGDEVRRKQERKEKLQCTSCFISGDYFHKVLQILGMQKDQKWKI